MKKIIQYILVSTILCTTFWACSDEENAGMESLAVVTFWPTIVMEGTELVVTGTGFDRVKEVVFPGEVRATSIEIVDSRTLKAIVPAGVSEEDGVLTLKSEDSEAFSSQFIRKAVPTFNYFNPSEQAATYQNLFIIGKDMMLVDAIRFDNGEEELLVQALNFVRKSNTQIIVRLSPSTPLGEKVEITAFFKNGENLLLGNLKIEEGEEGESGLTDPITDKTIMLNDFEDDGEHNAGWDASWTNSEATEFIVDTNGNTYLRIKEELDGWIFNCNHVDRGTVSGIENYEIKLDILIERGVEGAETAGMQFVIADNWWWFGDGFFPESTDNQWITIRFDASQWLSGDLEIGSITNGLYGGVVPAGICIDNFRLDPK